MSFDPDAFLAETAPDNGAAFDPDAFLAETDPGPARGMGMPISSASDENGVLGHVQDAAVSLAKGVVGVPELAVGLLDIPTGGRVGKFLENEGGAIGFRPGQAKEFLSEGHTDRYRSQQEAFSNADGVMEKAKVAIANPALIGNMVIESLPSMGAGGAAARGVMAGSKALGLAANPAVAGAVGEGLAMAGAQAESTRQQTDNGLLTAKQSALAAATGVGGALFGFAGGKLAQRLGIGDVDTMLARGVEPDAVVQEIAKLPAKSIPRQIIEGAISEGLFEELPQSVSETISQNMALDKPWHEGIEDSIVMGTLAGMAMGGPAAGLNGLQQNRARKAFEQLGGVQAQQELMDEQIAVDKDALVSGEDALKKAAAKGASLEDVMSMEQERAAGLDALKQKQAARAALKEKELAAQAEVDDALAEKQQTPSVQDQLRADAGLPVEGEFQPAVAADDVASKAAPRSTREVVRDWQDMGVLTADITEADGTITIGKIEMQEGASGTAEDALQHLTNYAKAAGKQLVQKEVAPPRNDQPPAGAATSPEAAPTAVDFASGKDGQDLAGMQQQLLPAAQNQEQHSAGPVAESRAAALEAADGGVANAPGSTGPDTPQAAEIETAAHEAATSPANDLPEPTQAQKEAGNYKKGHIKLQGLDITVENPRGSTRSGQREDGSTWEHEMSDHYGYIKRTEGADGEQVDVYVGPRPDADQVFVVDQLDQKSGQFDEHKAMLGFADEASAVAAYRSNFDDGWKVGPVRAMSMDEFRQWVKEGDTRKPAADQPAVKESLTAQGEQTVVQAPDTAGAQDSASTTPPGGDGWVPRLSSKGKPFSGAALAERSARENKFPEYRIEPVEGGFAIMLPPAAPADSAAEEKPTSLGRQIISSKKKTRARLERRAQQFAPGNIIASGYNGSHDRVLQYEDDGKGEWRVQVEAVAQQPDGSWKATGQPRWHRTEPDSRDRVVVEAKPAVGSPNPEPAETPVQQDAPADRRKVDRRLVDPTAAKQDEARRAMEKTGMAPEQAAKAAAAVKASTDELLGNTYYTHHLVPAIERAQKSGVPYAYYHVEMENLGGLNKIIGSAVQTDDELALLAREIRNITPDGVLVSHGGSNFGLLVPADQMALVDKELADISGELAARGMELAKQHGYADVPGKGGGKNGLGLLYKGEQIDPKADPGKIITDVKKAATPDEVGGTQHVNGTQIQESWARSLPGGNARVQSGTFAYSGKTPEAASGRSGALGSVVQQPGREAERGVAQSGVGRAGQTGSGNRQDLVGRKTLRSAAELRRRQLEKIAQQNRVGEGQLEEFARFFDEAKLDDTTGLWAKTELRPLFDDAIRVVNDGTPVQYVSVDISNLSGMNKGLSRNEKDSRKLADILFKAITDMTREKLDATGASVQGIRQGGDEISFFVAGVEMAAVQQAMNDAKQDIADWLETTGYSKLPHLKSYTPEVLAGTAERDTSKDGSGIYVGFSPIKENTKLRDVLEWADSEVAEDKENPKPAPRTTFDPEAWKYLPVQTLDGKPLVDEGKAVLFNKQKDGISMPVAGIDRATADTVVANFLKDYQGAKRLSIRIFDDKVQAYGMAKLAFNKMLDARIKGSFGNGQLQLILDAHDSAEDLLRTLRHEVWAHYGMDLLNDAQKKRLRLSLEILRLESPELRSLWKNRVLRDYSNASYEVQTEELLAAVAEEYGDLVDARAKENALTRTVRKAFRILRDLLAKIGVVRQADGLDKVVDMLADSAGRMRKDTVPGTEAAEMRFNKQEPGSGEPTAITLLDASKHPKGTERAELIPVVGNLSNLLKEHGVQVRISDSMNGWPANIRNQADEHAAVVVAGKTIFVAADMLDSKHDLTLAILRDIRRRTGKTRPADIVAEINSHLRRLPSGEQVAKLKNLSIDQMKRSSLALLTLRQLTDIGQKHLPGLQAYSVMHGKMVGSRNAMMNAVGEHVKHWEKWSGRKENRAMANQLHDLMNDSTRMGVDPSVDYMPLTTPEETKATIKMLNEQARGLGGDSRMIAKIIEKKKAAKAKLAHEQERAEAYPDLRKRWEALSGEAQAIYTNSRDMMTQRRHDMLKALEDRIADEIADHEQRKVMIDRLRLEFESNRVDPYFPLFRHGNYWVAIKDGEGNNQAFHMFDTEAEWQEFKDGYEATGHTVAAGKNIENLMSERGVDPGFVADVSDLLNDLPPGTSERLRDEVYQLYLQTLPNLSMRKHFIHRQGTKGYSRDALHAFANNSFHGIHQLAKLQYGYKLGKIVAAAEEAVRIAADPAKLAKLEEDVLDAMDAADAINAQEDARASDKEALNRLAGDMAQLLMDAERSAKNTPRAADLVSEMKQRHDWVMNPKMSAWAQRSSSAAFMFYLGFSPAAALVNTSQVPLMTLPVLAERFGMAKSGAMITKVTKEFFASGIDKRGFFSLAKTLQGDELKAYQYFLDQGVFESLAHDIAGVAENGALNSEVGAKVMAAASWGFHKAEVFNREVTAFAGYRLARESGASHDVALRYAEKLVWDTQFDYSNANRARFMQNNWMKVFTQFKQYAFSVLYLWGRAAHQSIKGETPEVQKMARKRLRGLALMNFLGAGLFGMLPDPLYQAAKALIASMMGDDDDDPIDVEAEMRQMIAELMGDLLGNEAYGRKAAQAITGGVGNAAGIDLASRIGISHLLFQDDGREAEGRDQYLNLLEAFAGPVFGMLKNMFLGAVEFADGNWMRGVERVVPIKGFRDLAKAARYATEGARTRRGDELVEDVELGEIMVQAIGFSPVRIADQYDQNNANMNRKTKLDDRKRDLTDSYIRALKEKDGERRTEVMAEITAFNKKNPDRAITGAHIQRVMAGRVKYSAKAKNGIVAPREYDFSSP